MNDIEKQKRIIGRVEASLGQSIIKIKKPKQGMGSSVLCVGCENGAEYVIKIGEDVFNDVRAMEIIGANNLDIPVPRIINSFPFEGGDILVMEKINLPLLEDIPDDDKRRYIISMLEILKKIHLIKSDSAGSLQGRRVAKTWKEVLLFKYSGNHPWFDWLEIVRREGVDGELVQKSIESVRGKIGRTDLPEKDFSLLHTDFNQRNLFVNPATHQIAAIIDWSEAMFGDPLYDFARVRMFIFHFSLGEDTEQEYFQSLKLTAEERVREELYLESQVLDYIAWYSEKKNNFNTGRLKLHQDFLRRHWQ